MHSQACGPSLATQPPNQPLSKSDRSTKFICNTCNCTMDVRSKESHLNGKKHIRKLGNPEEAFLCEICDLRMHPKSKESHLSGRRHLANQKSPVVPVNGTRNRATAQTLAPSALSGKGRTRINSKNGKLHWKPRTDKPRRVMLRYPKSSVILGLRLHPNGKRYIQIINVKRVYNHLHEIPLAAYGCVGRFSLVTPENVEAASDVLASQGFFHEIDDRWEITVDNGVYTGKESDFYEPGEYDFY